LTKIGERLIVARTIVHSIFGSGASRSGQAGAIGLVCVPQQILLQFLVAQTKSNNNDQIYYMAFD